jgi:hypothetical protein
MLRKDGLELYVFRGDLGDEVIGLDEYIQRKGADMG